MKSLLGIVSFIAFGYGLMYVVALVGSKIWGL